MPFGKELSNKLGAPVDFGVWTHLFGAGTGRGRGPGRVPVIAGTSQVEKVNPDSESEYKGSDIRGGSESWRSNRNGEEIVGQQVAA